jgi:hypothetical protein
MSRAHADIARLLGNARRRMAAITVLSRAGAGLAAALVLLLAGALALALGARIGVRWVALGGALLALLAAVAWTVRDLVRRVGGDAATARTVAAGDAPLRSALQSAMELARAREAIAAGGQLSVALVDAHLDRTAERARAFDLSRALPAGPARRAGWLLLFAVMLHVTAFSVGRRPLLHAYQRVLLGDPPGSPVQTDPITGDIEVTYHYPDYMRRAPRTLSGTGGEVRAPKGTRVALRTRADRPVARAELQVDADARPLAPGATPAAPASPAAGTSASAAPAPAAISNRYALTVSGGRDLAGGFLVGERGGYRFRFFDAKGRVLAEGPPIPIVVEPDLPPDVRITAPDRELEIDPGATVEIGWEAEDDVGLGEVTLVLEPPGGGEVRRIPLRTPEAVRRDGGSYALPVAPLQLAEGDRLTYHVEARDGDTVSGPKVSASASQVLRVYSAAEHRRQMLDRAKQAFEELVANLGDRLDLRGRGGGDAEERLPQAQALDTRTRTMTEHLRTAAKDIRADPAGPREVAQALDNVAQSVRGGIEAVIGIRARVGFSTRVLKDARDEPRRRQAREELKAVLAAVDAQDASLERSMEKGVLYLEQLLDKRRAEDLLALAKDLGKKRRDLADLMERFRKAPSDQAKQELLAQVRRLKEQVKDLLQRMADLGKGFNDEHMNEEALAELAKSQDLMGGLDEVEKKLAEGDVEGAMKALDQMAGMMDRMMAGLSRTAGAPDEKTQALMKEMLAFKKQLEELEQAQKGTASETEKIRAEYRKRIREQLAGFETALKRLQALAKEAHEEVAAAKPGTSFRSEPSLELSDESLGDLERALSMRELDGAQEAVRRALPAVEQLVRDLELDVAGLIPVDPARLPKIEEAHRRVAQAAPKVREIRDALQKLLPDPRQVLGKEEQKRLGELAKRQGELEQEAAKLQQALSQLAQKAPIFPPQAQGELSESRGHMAEAAGELGNRNPQRGRGEQDLAMDALARFRKGLEDATKNMQPGGSGGGFPYPFGGEGSEGQGEGFDPSREKVAIPGAEAHKVPEAFRKDLLEAMKQGTPERYRPDVQRYYEELVK